MLDLTTSGLTHSCYSWQLHYFGLSSVVTRYFMATSLNSSSLNGDWQDLEEYLLKVEISLKDRQCSVEVVGASNLLTKFVTYSLQIRP